MLPKVIMHNSISLDGSVKDFEVNMGLHYQIAGSYGADVHLIGSNTAKIGMEMFLPEIPPFFLSCDQGVHRRMYDRIHR